MEESTGIGGSYAHDSRTRAAELMVGHFVPRYSAGVFIPLRDAIRSFHGLRFVALRPWVGLLRHRYLPERLFPTAQGVIDDVLMDPELRAIAIREL
jgi:hypothetical protein